MDTLVYQTEAHNYTPEKVAKEFADKYFDKPREVDQMSGNKFTLVNGIATYEVRYVEGIHLVSLPVYKVFRL